MSNNGGTNNFEASLRWVQMAKGQISRDEYAEGTEKPYSSKSILDARKAERQRHETRGERRRITIRLKADV